MQHPAQDACVLPGSQFGYTRVANDIQMASWTLAAQGWILEECRLLFLCLPMVKGHRIE